MQAAEALAVPSYAKPSCASRTITPRLRTFPARFFAGYLLFGIAVYALGPWPWEDPNPSLLYVFLLGAYLFLLLGFVSARNVAAAGYTGKWSIESIIKTSLFVSLVVLGPAIYYKANGQFDLVSAIVKPGEAYHRSLQRAANAEGGRGSPSAYAVVYLEAATAPVCQLLFPLTIVYRRRLRRKMFAACLAVVLASLLGPVLMGVNKGIADFVLLLPWFIWLSWGSNRPRIGRGKLALSVIALVGLFGVFSVHLARNVATRAGKENLEDYYQLTQRFYDRDNLLLRYLPDGWKPVVIAAGGYGVAGYHGLALSLEENFVWTYGLGHSFVLTSYAEKLLGRDQIRSRTYPARVEQHTRWDSRVRWSSIFPWIASDLSFIGVFPLMFIVGRGVATCWLDVLRGENPFALGVFGNFVILLFYMPANNQLTQTLPSFIGFWTLLVMWLVTRDSRPRRELERHRIGRRPVRHMTVVGRA